MSSFIVYLFIIISKATSKGTKILPVSVTKYGDACYLSPLKGSGAICVDTSSFKNDQVVTISVLETIVKGDRKTSGDTRSMDGYEGALIRVCTGTDVITCPETLSTAGIIKYKSDTGKIEFDHDMPFTYEKPFDIIIDKTGLVSVTQKFGKMQVQWIPDTKIEGFVTLYFQHMDAIVQFE